MHAVPGTEPAAAPNGGAVIRRSGTGWSNRTPVIVAGLGAALALATVAAAADPPTSAGQTAATSTSTGTVLTWTLPTGTGRTGNAATGAGNAATDTPASFGSGPAGRAPVASRPMVRRFPAAGTPSWQLSLIVQYLPSTNQTQYVAVIAGARQAWVFGGSNLAGHGVPEVAHRINGQWGFPLLPAGLYSWIAAASAQSPADIWAVTHLGGFLLHWNGSNWQTEPRGGWRASVQFTGINAVSARSVWLFGAGSRGHPGGGTWHWDGTSWSPISGIAGGIRQASPVSATDMWAIGGIGGTMNALLRFSGSSWAHVTPAALAGFRYSDVVALAARNVWVAGLVAGQPKLAHYDGRGWTVRKMPGTVAATGICRDGRGGIWVIANSGKAPSELRDLSAAGRWTTATVSSSSADEILACALVPGTQAAWGAGKSAALNVKGSAAAVYGFGNVP